VLLLKASRKQQYYVIHFLSTAKGFTAYVIQFEMRPVYGDKCCTRPAVHAWCINFAHDHESVVGYEEPGRRVLLTTDITITDCVANGILSSYVWGTNFICCNRGSHIQPVDFLLCV